MPNEQSTATEDRALIKAQLQEAEETIRKPFLKLSQLRKGQSIEVKMVGPRYGKTNVPTWGKDKEQMSAEQLAQLQTFYLYDLQVTKSDSDLINKDVVYEYSCPKSYYKDTTKETESGAKNTIKGLRSYFIEGHRQFRITKVREGVSTQFRNYQITPTGKADPQLAFT